MRVLLILAALVCGLPAFAANRCDTAVATGQVDVGEVRLAYQSVGRDSDPALLLVMGLGGQLIHWPDDVVERLCRQGFRVIRFDNRDVGLSTWARPAPDLMVAGVVHDIKFDSNILGEGEVPRFRAAIFGQALCEPSWTFEWSAPSPDDPAYSAAGDRAQARGTVLLLSIEPWAESNATVTLTAQARCAGQTVATLTFEVRHIW